MIGGLLLMLVGGLVAVTSVFQAYTAAQASAQVERLSPLTVASLADTRPEQTVLIEGHISPSTPIQFQHFVAYIRESKANSGGRPPKRSHRHSVSTVLMELSKS